MKFKVLQEVVNKRYCVYQEIPTNVLCLDIKDDTIVSPKDRISSLLIYIIKEKMELIDREVIDEFERNDMVYKIGDKIWYKNEVYKIKDIIYTYDAVRLYINKQRINKEIGKVESEKLLEEIKNEQRNIRQEENRKQIKLEERNQDKNNSKHRTKNFIHKIKRLFKRR